MLVQRPPVLLERLLTCFSVIPYWQKHGVAPNDPLSECYLQIDHPNSKDLKLAIETRELQKTWAADEQYVCNREAIEEDKTYLIPSDRAKYDKKKSIIEQCDNEISTIKRFDQSGNQALGFVFASSGDKTQVVQTTPYKESVVDWALIHIKGGQMGQNTVRSVSHTMFGSQYFSLNRRFHR